MKNEIKIIVAVQEKDRGIGINNDLLFRISPDIKRFQELTMGYPVVTGRKNYESVPDKYRPLKGRTNIVITRNENYKDSVPEGVIVVHSLSRAIEEALNINSTIFIIGGGQIYKEVMEMNVVDTIEMTIVKSDRPADTFFPAWPYFTKEEFISEGTDEKTGLSYRFVRLTRN